LGQNEKISGAPTLASILAEELQALGVPPENIIREERSGSTHQQLIEVAKILRDKGIESAGIISNDFHLPRIEEFIKNDPELRQLFKGREIIIMSAEKIALAHDRERWEKEIKAAYESEAMRRRIELEERGVTDIRQGRYKFR